MTYRVEELAAAAGVRIDTVRFYQTKGLLPPPRRVKRTACYSDEHLALLRRIRRYQSEGLSLAVIKRLLAGRADSRTAALITAVADQGGERVLTRSQLAQMSGVPEPLLASLEAAALLEPVTVDGQVRYGEADMQMVSAGLEILQQGFPIDELLGLAMRHAKGVREVADRAIELFDRYVRETTVSGGDARAVTAAFRRLLPAVTTLVALHFQRTLLTRGLERLTRKKDRGGLRAAAAALRGACLEVRWR